MRKTEHNQQWVTQSLLRRVKKMTVSDAIDIILSDATACAALIDLTDNVILFTNRMDMVLSVPSNISINDFHNLIHGEFYRSLYKSFAKAAQEILFNNENICVDFHYQYTFQVKTLLSKQLGEFLHLCEDDEPIVLITDNGDHFACIAKYRIVGMGKEDSFSKPLVMKKGVICLKESDELLRSAGHHILNKLRFTQKELDVLEELANGNPTDKIAKKMKIVPSTVEGYRRDIRKKVKNGVSKDLNDVKMALRLRSLKVL